MDYVAKNKAAWDASAKLHKEAKRWSELKEGFKDPSFKTFDETATKMLQEINLSGKTVAQLGCNNGRETLSLLNMGAGSATGFDQSSEFLKQAEELREISGGNARFVTANILDLPIEFDGAFDLVVITIGVLNWIPDLNGLMETAQTLLKPGGELFIYETHPVLDMLEPEGDAPFELQLSYFRKDPYVIEDAITYTKEKPEEKAESYWFFHPLGAIISAVISQQMTLTHFEEYGHSNREEIYDKYAQRAAKIPMCFTLRARKEA